MPVGPSATSTRGTSLATIGLLSVSGCSFFGFDVDPVLRRLSTSAGFASLPSTFLFATGQDKPRSLPLLATPTSQVNAVLYPEHSLPMSRHCEQYGRLRSHFTLRFRHVKQSSLAPPPAVRRRLFLGGGTASTEAVASKGSCSSTADAMWIGQGYCARARNAATRYSAIIWSANT